MLILNDDYTPMEFVVHVLEKFFQKDVEAATKIMLHVHHHGIGECGVFTYEIAETKVTQVMDFARKHQHPAAMRDGKEVTPAADPAKIGTGLASNGLIHADGVPGDCGGWFRRARLRMISEENHRFQTGLSP